MNDESRKTKRKTRCYIICAVILIIMSIAAIEVAYQVHFKNKGKFRYMISITFFSQNEHINVTEQEGNLDKIMSVVL